MPNYRRAFVPGGTFFFTVVTYARRPIFAADSAITLLGEVFRECQREWPFEMIAIVLMPNHLHAMWSLHGADPNYSARWSRIKKEFTKRWLKLGGTEVDISEAARREHRKGIWQRRFWEHTIVDEQDFETHFDYIHFNPVKHGHVRCPADWRASSFHRWVAAGVYSPNWACADTAQSPDFRAIEDNCGEP